MFIPSVPCFFIPNVDAPNTHATAFSTQVLSYGAPLSPMFDFQHDYPSPALPYLPSSPVEELAAHPVS
jgi:hypothetical protein